MRSMRITALWLALTFACGSSVVFCAGGSDQKKSAAALPTASHVFLPGHRIMVQVQSSWFPLYDRNPQSFVENIFWARCDDFRRAVQRIYHSPGQESFIELPLVKTP